MRIVDNEEFLAWAAYRGLHLDARYEQPQTLCYPNGSSTIVVVDLSDSVRRWKGTLNCAFCLLPRTPLWLYRRGGAWDFLSFSDEQYISLRQGYNAVLENIGVSKGKFSIQFSEHEHALVQGLLALHTMTASGVRDDLFVVPETAEFLIWVSHDDELILICRNEQVEERLRSQTREWDWILPPRLQITNEPN